MISRAIALLFVCVFSSVHAQEWFRGSVVVLEASQGATVTLAGNEQALPIADSLPLYLPGFFSADNAHGESTFLRTSNGVDLYFEGEGFFGFERFEGMETEVFDDEQSRMILNLRRGLLVIDSTNMSGSSQLMVETPFGRLSGARSKWYVSVEFDLRSGIYDFTVSCLEGSVRLTDNNRNRYDVYRGQRIAGAGSYEDPSIEVGELTDQNRENLSEFAALQDSIMEDDLDQAALRAQMMRLNREASRGKAEEPLSKVTTSDKRPIVIEIAPKPPQITPFRAEVRPPSEYQTDLF